MIYGKFNNSRQKSGEELGAIVKTLKSLTKADLCDVIQAFVIDSEKGLELIGAASRGMSSSLKAAKDLNHEYAGTLMVLASKRQQKAFRARHLRNLILSGICGGTEAEGVWIAELEKLCGDQDTMDYLEGPCSI